MAVNITNHKNKTNMCPPEVSVLEYRSLHETQRRIVREWFKHRHKDIPLQFSGIATRGRSTVIFFYHDTTRTRHEPNWLHAWEVTYDPETRTTTDVKTH